MGKVYLEIDAAVRGFIEAQRMFFVATAPLSAGGHVNVSPKGLDCFRVLGPRRVAYMDFNGSGVETIAHARENGRMTVMFCAFEGKPKILRLYGRGRVVEPGEAEFDGLLGAFAAGAGGRGGPLVRSIIVLEVSRITDSCGHGVPLYEYKGDRELMGAWSEKMGPRGMREYQCAKNARSIDGLEGLRSAGSRGEGADL